MKTIKDSEIVVAIYIPRDIKVNGTKFITPESYPLQVGIIQYRKNRFVPPHSHRNFQYNVRTTQEFIYIVEGSNIEVTVFNNQWEELDKISMSSGDSILFVSGGHSLKIPKGSRLIEIKQGPYPGEDKAKTFMR